MSGAFPDTNYLGKIMLTKSFLLTAALAVAATTSLSGSYAYGGSESCDTRVNNTRAKLLECITLDGVRRHQAALQSVADANGGNRQAGTSGYDASVDYIVDSLESAGYTPELHEFDFLFLPPSTQAHKVRPTFV